MRWARARDLIVFAREIGGQWAITAGRVAAVESLPGEVVFLQIEITREALQTFLDHFVHRTASGERVILCGWNAEAEEGRAQIENGAHEALGK